MASYFTPMKQTASQAPQQSAPVPAPVPSPVKPTVLPQGSAPSVVTPRSFTPTVKRAAPSFRIPTAMDVQPQLAPAPPVVATPQNLGYSVPGAGTPAPKPQAQPQPPAQVKPPHPSEVDIPQDTAHAEAENHATRMQYRYNPQENPERGLAQGAKHIDDVFKDMNHVASFYAQKGDEALAAVAAQYGVMSSQLDAMEQKITEQIKSQMNGDDPAMQAAIGVIKQEVQKQQDATLEELNARGLVQSGVYAEMVDRLNQGAQTQIQQVVGQRMGALQDQLNNAIMTMSGYRVSTLQQSQQNELDIRKQTAEGMANLGTKKVELKQTKDLEDARRAQEKYLADEQRKLQAQIAAQEHADRQASIAAENQRSAAQLQAQKEALAWEKEKYASENKLAYKQLGLQIKAQENQLKVTNDAKDAADYGAVQQNMTAKWSDKDGNLTATPGQIGKELDATNYSDKVKSYTYNWALNKARLAGTVSNPYVDANGHKWVNGQDKGTGFQADRRDVITKAGDAFGSFIGGQGFAGWDKYDKNGNPISAPNNFGLPGLSQNTTPSYGSETWGLGNTGLMGSQADYTPDTYYTPTKKKSTKPAYNTKRGSTRY